MTIKDSLLQVEDQVFLDTLESGFVRAASLQNGEWAANLEVKERILQLFKNSENIQMGEFVDKSRLPLRHIRLDDKVRLVPGGSSIRRGAFVGKGVIVMPPSYINIGAFVDEGSMVDSHVLVGSCAQIGKRVHLSAAVQIGGVLEPVGERPVIIEDDAFIGAGCIIVEGIIVRKRAVLAPGVILSRSMPIFDLVNEKELPRGAAIPENAVVVSGSRELKNEWGKKMGLKGTCALIIKYRDEKSDLSLLLEESLR